MKWRVDDPEERLITIASFCTDAEFQLARSRLESADIECFGRNEHTTRIAGIFSGALGVHEIELQVRESDAEDAFAMLNSESPLAEDETAEDYND